MASHYKTYICLFIINKAVAKQQRLNVTSLMSSVHMPMWIRKGFCNSEVFWQRNRVTKPWSNKSKCLSTNQVIFDSLLVHMKNLSSKQGCFHPTSTYTHMYREGGGERGEERGGKERKGEGKEGREGGREGEIKRCRNTVGHTGRNDSLLGRRWNRYRVVVNRWINPVGISLEDMLWTM